MSDINKVVRFIAERRKKMQWTQQQLTERLKILSVFQCIKANGLVDEREMLRTFNCGVGLVLMVMNERKEHVIRRVSPYYECYEICMNRINWGLCV